MDDGQIEEQLLDSDSRGLHRFFVAHWNASWFGNSSLGIVGAG